MCATLRTNNTPNQLALHAKLAALEGSEAALVAASGMAVVSTTLLTLLAAGDRLLAQSCLYGGTRDFLVRDFPKFGLHVDFIDADAPASWRAQLRPTTRAIYVESMTNPLLEVCDLEAVVEFARAHGLVSIIDNTFASPVNYRPIEAGFDLCLHSATKYLNGHTDLIAGAISGRAELIERIRHQLNRLGGCLDPHAAFLLNRGLDDARAAGALPERECAQDRAVPGGAPGGDPGQLSRDSRPTRGTRGRAACSQGSAAC